MSVEELKKQIEFYKGECKAVAWIGALCGVIGSLCFFILSNMVIGMKGIGMLMMLLGAGLLLIGVPYYGFKVIKLTRQMKRSG